MPRHRLCNERFRTPWFGLLKILRAPSERLISAEVKQMREFALGVVKARRQELTA
eukprot:SAG31_NODE_43530_length_266_cov_1.856287_1_plen_54_part_10